MQRSPGAFYRILRKDYRVLRILKKRLLQCLFLSMQESLLHFIWKNRLIQNGAWRTSEGEPLRVFKTGIHNHDAGPDFFEAMISLGKERWMGSVEIHWHAREWFQHGHQNDPAYNNVILHVVWEGSQPAQRADGTWVPTFELKNWVESEMLMRYQLLMQQFNAIPCSGFIEPEILPFFTQMLDRTGVERLEHRVMALEALLNLHNGNWEQTFWVALAGAFGLKVNRQPMEALAEALPIQLLHKHQADLKAIEALLFGQAGFLNETNDDPYLVGLQAEYAFLKAKYRLKPLVAASWKFLRMRPGGFPTRRIAQLAKVLHQQLPLFQNIREKTALSEIKGILAVQPSAYWQQHFRPNDKGKGKSGIAGEEVLATWLINAVIPAVFLYGRKMHLPAEEEKALNWLEEMKPEQNNVLHLYAKHGVIPVNALQSQGILELYKHYCQEQRCLHCIVGCKLLLTKQTKHAKTG